MISFEEYAERMQPWLEKVSRKQARRGNVFMAREDLEQEARISLMRTYNRHQNDGTTVDELCRLGTTAMVGKMQSVFKRQLRTRQAYRRRLAESAKRLLMSATDAEEYVKNSQDRQVILNEMLHAPDADALERVLFRERVEDELALTPRCQELLVALTSPTDASQDALPRIIRANTSRRVSSAALAAAADQLGVPYREARKHYRRTTAQVHTLLGYDKLNGAQTPKPKEANMEILNPEPETATEVTAPAAAEPTAAEVAAPAKPKRAAKPKAEKAPKAPKAEKAPKAAKAKKAAKPKAEKKAAAQGTGKPLFKVGDVVEYVGESRAKRLQVGSVGKISRVRVTARKLVRYRIRFKGLDGKGKARTTTLGERYVKASK